MEHSEDYQNLLMRVDEKVKEVKSIYDELSKSYSSKDIGKHPKYDEKYQQWHLVALKFLTLHVYHKNN